MWQRTDLAQVKRNRHTGKPQKAGNTKAFRLRQSISFAEMRRKRLSLPTGEVRPSEHDYDYKELFYMTTKGIYNTLVTQLDKLARHNRQGSFRTKARYYEAVKRFCAYLAAHYYLQKLENISGKHLMSYVLYLQEQGKSANTIKTDLSAIRFFHDKMSHPRCALPDNEELGVALERRRFGQQDRTWTNSEFGKLIGRAMAEEREDYILALYLARYAGLRIHECFRIDTAIAERTLRENALTVKGKGGKVRIVPIEDDRITMMLQRLLEKTERGHKLLVPDGVPTDRAINGMQQFILRHRDAICDPTVPDRRITFHGLRHTYAAEKYTSLVSGGMTPLDAHFTVSRLLGHERPDVTGIYLASVKGGAARGE